MLPQRRPAKLFAMIALTLLLSLSGLTLTGEKAAAASYSYQVSPDEPVGITKPVIIFYFSTDMPGAPDSYSMTLDGEKVAASYDKAKEAYVYTPVKDLEPGFHTARMTITYVGFEPVEKTWTFVVAKDAVKQFASAGLEQQHGLAAINDYRVLYGLPPVIMNDRLNTSASAHANYLNTNKIQQSDESTESLHTENPDKPGYTGKTPSERAAYYGYASSVGEDAAYNRGTIAETIDALFDAPYHRTPFLDPSIKEIGVGKTGDYTIIEFGMGNKETPKLVVSPAPGDRYVPTAFGGNETPDPLRIHKNHDFPVGYPIMAHYFGDGVEQVKLLAADITDSGNKSVPFLINTPAEDDSLTNAVILMPRKPLQADSTYRVMLMLQVTMQDGSKATEVKEWDFTTEPVAEIGKKKLHLSAADYIKRFVSTVPVPRVASFGLDADTYTVDGTSFPMMRKPVIADGSSYLYIRDLASALGAGVEWDANQRAAVYTKGSQKVTLYTTRNEIEVNGVLRTTDSPARLIGDYTMVPVRLLAEVLGAKISYTEATRTVTITY